MADSAITVVGNLTREPEGNVSAAGNLYCRFGIAVNHRRKVGDEWEEEASFFEVSVLDSQMADNVLGLPKGSRVVVTGRLQQRTVEQDDGTNRSYVSIVADEVGASLRWATVAITRNPKKESSVGRQGVNIEPSAALPFFEEAF